MSARRNGRRNCWARASACSDPRWISSRQLLALHDTGTNWLLVTRTLDGDAAGLQPLPHEATYDTTKP